MTRDDARAALTDMLLEHVRRDRFPSSTHMELIEGMISPSDLPDYIAVLLDKVKADSYPSLTMIRRIQHLSASLPSGA